MALSCDLAAGGRLEVRLKSKRETEMETLEEDFKVWQIQGVSYLPYSEFDFYKREDLDSLYPDANGLVDFSKLTPRFFKVESANPDQDEAIGTGFNNLQMGAPNDFSRPCQTCGQMYTKCQGHFGLIYLKKLIFYHQLFVGDLRYLLSCFCMESFERTKDEMEPELHLVVSKQTVENDEAYIATKGKERIRLMSQTTHCEICGAANRQYKIKNVVMSRPTRNQKRTECRIPTIKKKDKYQGLNWEKIGSRSEKHPLHETQAYRLLRAFDMLPDERRFEMLDMLGYNSHPYLSGMIVTHLVVVPPNYRNRRVMGAETAKQKVSLDETYSGILKCLNVNASELMTYREVIGNRITSLMKVVLINNTLSHKSGLIRRDLDGTRSNFSGRTVVTLDAWLEVDQVGIPNIIADKITIRVKVGKRDKFGKVMTVEEAKRRILTGEITAYFPGKKPDIRKMIHVSGRARASIHDGDWVERKLEDNDYALLNRQPTIHSRGIMAYRVKRVSGKSIRISMYGTTPLHADFDGDEVNIQVPQTEGAIRQSENEANIRNLILNPHDQGVMIGLVFELLDAGSRLTDNAWINREIYEKIMEVTFRKDSNPTYDGMIDRARKVGLRDDEIFNESGINGRILFSTILPKDFNHTNGKVVISKGILVKGQIISDHIGTHPGGSIIQALILEDKAGKTDTVVDFLNRGNRLLLSWQDYHPTTFGPDDYVIGIGRAERNKEKYEVIRREHLDAMTDTTRQMQQFNAKIIWPMERQLMQRMIYQKWDSLRGAMNEIINNMVLEEISVGKITFSPEYLQLGKDLFQGNLGGQYQFITDLLGDRIRNYPEWMDRLFQFSPDMMAILTQFYLRNNIMADAEVQIQSVIIRIIANEFSVGRDDFLSEFPEEEIDVLAQRLRGYPRPNIPDEILHPPPNIPDEILQPLTQEFVRILNVPSRSRDLLLDRIVKAHFKGVSDKILPAMRDARRASRLVQALAIGKYCEQIFGELVEIPKEKLLYVSRMIYDVLLGLAIHNPLDLVNYLPLLPETIKIQVFNVVDDPIEREWIETTRLRQLATSFSDFMKRDNIQLSYLPDFSFIRMAKKAGSKGKDSHPGMDIAVGQQYLRGTFLPVLNNMNRALVYDRNTIDPASRGFVEESLMAGVSPRSSFEMHMAGRETNIIAANETPSSGYAHRRLGMTMENMIVGPNATVVSGKKRLIQLIFGDDGFSPERMVMAGAVYAQPVYSFMDIRGTIIADTAGMGFF